jgi:two-component system response regulator AtoC
MNKILVIDDSLVILKALGGFLAERGFSVYMSDSIEKALTLSNEESFDLVVADSHLKGGSGIELINKIKKAQPKIKTIIMSGNFDFKDKGLKTDSFDAFLQKPFEGKELEALINKILK